jgi:tetratricopeptide (TPR) repeat protein
LRGGLAAAAILAALLLAWSQWQPQRSEAARQEALDLLASKPVAAEAAATGAVSRDPLSAEALFTLADVQSVRGAPAQARATLEKAVRLQPSNPKTWLELGRFELSAGRPAAALSALRATVYLNPESIAPESIASGQREGIELYNDYIQALRATQSAARVKSASGRRAGAGSGARPGARRRSAPPPSGTRNPRSAG